MSPPRSSRALGPPERMFGTIGPTASVVDGPYALGTKFRVWADGIVTALRFYRVADSTATSRPVVLWTDAGIELAKVVTTLPMEGGQTPGVGRWVEVPLPVPVPVTAGGVYVVSFGHHVGQGSRAYVGSLIPSASPNLEDLASAYVAVASNNTSDLDDFPTGLSSASSYLADVVYQTGAPDAPRPAGSRLMATRGAIATALEAGGLRVAFTGKFAAPCVLVEAGEPWAGVDVSLHGKRVARWKLTLVAGRTDSEGALDTLAELVDTADAALLKLPGVQLPTWAKPYDAQLGTIPYAATIATIQIRTEEESL